MMRTSEGAYAVLPPKDLPSIGAVSARTQTREEAGGDLLVQHVVPKRAADHRIKPQINLQHGKVMEELLAASAKSGHSDVGVRQWPELTREVAADIKSRLDSLATLCRCGEFSENPRPLKHFLTELPALAAALQIHTVDKSYRKSCDSSKLAYFLRLVPKAQAGAFDLPAGGAPLPTSGFFASTMLLALQDVPWEFTCNMLRYKICNCPGNAGASDLSRCLAPWNLDCSRHDGTGAGSDGEVLRRTERHFSPQLRDITATVRRNFRDLVRQVPNRLKEFQSLPVPCASQAWDRFVVNLASHVTVFDRYYVRFEQLYLGIVDRMIGTALEPVKGLTELTGSLVHQPGDPFRPVQTAVLCQRLGLLNRHVDFGGAHRLVHFDPGLLAKARRLLSVDAYPEVRAIASDMIDKFEKLCRLLDGIESDKIQPELRLNDELRTAVLDLEAVWAEGQHILQQSALDFIEELLRYVEHHGGSRGKLPASFRWHLRLAVENRNTLEKDKGREVRKAEHTLFETLPIIMYLDELWWEFHGAHGSKPMMPCFRQIFCTETERTNHLRADISKYEEGRFAKLVAFVLAYGFEGLGESDHDFGDEVQTRYFQNVYRSLREVTAFTVDSSASTRAAEDAAGRRVQWVCMHRIAQHVRPLLFPQEDQAASDKSPGVARRRDGSKGDAMGGPLAKVKSQQALAPASAIPDDADTPEHANEHGA